MLKLLKKWAILLLVIVVLFLSAGLILSLKGETRTCKYLWETNFSINDKEFSAAIYSFDNEGTDMYGLTVARSGKLEGEVLCLPSFLYLSGEKSVVSFDWGKLALLISSVILIFVIILPKRKKIYEIEEDEEEPEEEKEEEENENECPNCRERIFDGLEYCENCGINIENFKKKMKKRNR
jgi:hypothetical protein